MATKAELKTEKQQILLKAMENFKDAALELLEVWDEQDYETSDLMNINYPFHIDFAELIYHIMDWNEAVKNRINKG